VSDAQIPHIRAKDKTILQNFAWESIYTLALKVAEKIAITMHIPTKEFQK
jgi:hypothetical protein